MSGFKKLGEKLLNFGGRKPDDGQPKKIIWASEYEKWKKDNGRK